MRYRKFGFFGGRQDGDIESSDVIGIHNWARRGMVTRGILLDVKGYFEASGSELVPDERGMASRQRNWTWSPGGKASARARATSCSCAPAGLSGTCRCHWTGAASSSGPSASATGHWPVLAWTPGGRPPRGSGTTGRGCRRRQFRAETLPVIRDLGFLHYRLLPLLGMPIGELWWLKDLAAHCAQLHTYEFLLTSGVMDIPGRGGSPCNAYAVF